MFPVRIRYKYLSKTVACHQFYNLLYARCIQLIKDIIQQQQRNSSTGTFQKIKLCQLQCHKIRFVLSLRAFSFYRKISQ